MEAPDVFFGTVSNTRPVLSPLIALRSQLVLPSVVRPDQEGGGQRLPGAPQREGQGDGDGGGQQDHHAGSMDLSSSGASFLVTCVSKRTGAF